MNWEPLLLTFKLALITTIILFIVALPLAYWLAYSRSRFKVFVEAMVSMPLILPPTVIGFYLLLAFSPNNVFGSWLDQVFNLKLVFSFPGLVLASVLYSLPFMVQPIQAGFSKIPKNVLEAASLLRKSKKDILRHIIIPNSKPAIVTGLVLSFAHTIGEFGVVLMIGGSIPGKTKVASIAIYDEVEALNYGLANSYSLVLFAISFAILFMVYYSRSETIKFFGR
jgi:molybdate transport system permease protein